MTYKRHIPEKKMMCQFLKSLLILKKLSWAGSKPVVLLERFIVVVTNIVWGARALPISCVGWPGEMTSWRTGNCQHQITILNN